MTKKEYLEILLDKLSKNWDFAKWLNILLGKDILTDKIIDLLFEFFSDKLKNINNEDEKNKFNNTIKFLNKIKNLEDKDKISDDELDSLLSKI